MTEYEILEQQAYDLGIVVIKKHFTPGPNFNGLFFRWEGNPVIFINSRASSQEQRITLMEEIAHYEMTSGNILDQTKPENRKAEALARSVYYKKLLPSIVKAILSGSTMPWEIAELTDIPESTIHEIMAYCHRKSIAI